MPTYTNLVILQGWLEIESVSVTHVNRTEVPVLKGWIYTTDHAGLEKCFDERHPVLISGRPADAILEITKKIQDKLINSTGMCLVDMMFSNCQPTKVLTCQKRPFVIAQGKLLSHQGSSCLDVRHLSILGLPWGAFDALASLDYNLPNEAKLVLEHLSDTEKGQTGQVLGVALRSSMNLRQDNGACG